MRNNLALCALASVFLGAAAPAQAAQPELRVLLTGWYLADMSSPDAFFLRRANIWMTGEVAPELGYTLMINPAKLAALPTVQSSSTQVTLAAGGDTKILQDAFMTWKLSDDWKITGGQLRPPLSAEARQPAPRLPLARRALFLEGNSFGFYRDLGVQVAGKLGAGLSLTAGVFNGQATNVAETNDAKDVVARLDWSLWPGLTMGLSGLQGLRGTAQVPTTRQGANLELDLAPWQLSAELLQGTDGAISRLGWYGQLAYRPAPPWQIVLRHESWDADQAATGGQQDLTAGVNWFLNGPTKLALNLVHQTFTGPQARTNEQALLLWQMLL